MRRMSSLIWLELYTRRKRIAAIILFGAMYLVGALSVRALGAGPDGHVEADQLFQVGGYPLVSAFLLTGWSIGRYPLIIVVAMVAGLFSTDVRAGFTRIYMCTRVRILPLYGIRLGMLLLLSFVMSSVLLPTFDYIVLRQWSGRQVFVLIAAYTLVFGTLTALFSVFTRADAWATLFVWIAAMVWHSLLRGGLLARVPEVITQGLSVILPPQAALNSLENAFADAQAVPWGAFLYVCMYSTIVLLIAGLVASRKEI